MIPVGLMKKTACLLLLGVLACGGCARHYVLTLTNGAQIDAFGKPRHQADAYVFKNGAGQEQMIPAGRVREIAPASMGKKEKPPFLSKPSD